MDSKGKKARQTKRMRYFWERLNEHNQAHKKLYNNTEKFQRKLKDDIR